jgi:hypothetical protein
LFPFGRPGDTFVTMAVEGKAMIFLPLNRVMLAGAFWGLLFATPRLKADPDKADAAKPSAHVMVDIEGWTVRIDSRLREAPNTELGGKAEALLRAKLADIVTAVPADKVARLRQVPIWLDLTHGSLTSMQYHPGAEWLKGHGFDPALVKGLHIPVAARFVSARHQQVQPWSVLHELAHAYHDQVLGFESAEVTALWEDYKSSGHGDKVLHVDGRKQRHYALTNPKEFFAEMTEAYFGTNDFFPFVNGELKTAEPKIHALLLRVWGAAPVEPPP